MTAPGPVLWQPFPGPQTEFLRAPEFEVLYGGAKGGAKTDAILMGALRQVDRERWRAYIVRETGPQLSEIRDRSHRIFPRLRGRPAWRGDGHGRWIWPSGAQVIFESIGTPAEVDRINGKEPSYIGHDEVGNVRDERVVDLEQAELRSPDPEIHVIWRGSANPGKAGHAWVRRRFVEPCGDDGSRVVTRVVTLPSGREARIQRRYIPARVTDNPIYRENALYMAQLLSLPDVLRRQLLYGDWNAGVGTALDELDPAVHLIEPFPIPDHWTRFGAFDWGFSHPWSYGHYVVDEDGVVICTDSARGRHHAPHEFVERIEARVESAEWNTSIHHPQYAYTVAGHDIAARVRARADYAESTPTLQERVAELGLPMDLASIDRVAGLNNLRHYIAWRGQGRIVDGRRMDDRPALYWFDTPANRRKFAVLQSMVTDEDAPEDVLKVDADPISGEGGDDEYDETRYALASRPPRPIGAFLRELSARPFDPAVLRAEHDWKYRDKAQPMPERITSTP